MFRESCVYQVYPKSFRDSTGNGIGDLRGILEKVPYIASLGVDWVWFNPFYPSPQRDNGYDVSDYLAVDPAMGTMADFEELVAALAEHGIGVMLDMVLNHTSTEHEWFQRALAGDEKYQRYYYLREAQPDGSLPTNWVSKFGGPAWSRFGDTELYFLHLFDQTQADLDWHNPEVRAEAAHIVNFWLDKGVKGFRFDVINLIGKDTILRDAPAGTDDRFMYTDGADVHRYLQQLHRESFGRFEGTLTVGEMSSTTIPACVGYSNPDANELDMVFSSHHLKVDYEHGQKWTRIPYDFAALKRTLNDWAVGMEAGNGWNALFWNNHDQPRALNRFGDAGPFRVESATMLAAVLHLMRGTPFIYMGEEIGMTDPEYFSIDDYVDVEARNAYATLAAAGKDAFAIVHSKARDNARTPMQWDATPGAGFTSGDPWLKPTNHAEINVAAEEAAGRILAFYRRLIALRKAEPIIAEGSYAPFALEHEQVLGFEREFGGQRMLVLANFRGTDTQLEIPDAFVGADVLIGNYDEQDAVSPLPLRPFETIALVRAN